MNDQVELEDPEGAVLVEAGGVARVPHSEHSGLGAGGLDRATYNETTCACKSRLHENSTNMLQKQKFK